MRSGWKRQSLDGRRCAASLQPLPTGCRFLASLNTAPLQLVAGCRQWPRGRQGPQPFGPSPFSRAFLSLLFVLLASQDLASCRVCFTHSRRIHYSHNKAVRLTLTSTNGELASLRGASRPPRCHIRECRIGNVCRVSQGAREPVEADRAMPHVFHNLQPDRTSEWVVTISSNWMVTISCEWMITILQKPS